MAKNFDSEVSAIQMQSVITCSISTLRSHGSTKHEISLQKRPEGYLHILDETMHSLHLLYTLGQTSMGNIARYSWGVIHAEGESLKPRHE